VFEAKPSSLINLPSRVALLKKKKKMIILSEIPGSDFEELKKFPGAIFKSYRAFHGFGQGKFADGVQY